MTGRLLLLAVLGVLAANLTAAADTEAAIAVATELDVAREMLDEDIQRYAEHARARSRAVDTIDALYSALDRAVNGGDQAIEPLMREVERAEAERSELMTAGRVLVDRIRDRRRRISLLEERLETLRNAETEAAPLAGRWDVVLLPIDQRGTFSLKQSGTLVTGTYTLAGGFSGSLQGTLIDRKVHLVRIDSRLGRSMELEGHLSTDGNRITGSWLNYELAGGEGSTGQWTARRSAPDS